MSRRPFTLFEVEKVAEFPEPGSTNFCEPVIGDNVPEDAIRVFYTVYGYRPHDLDPDVDGGAYAIFDTDGDTPEEEESAIDLAFALADGKRIFFRGTEITND